MFSLVSVIGLDLALRKLVWPSGQPLALPCTPSRSKFVHKGGVVILKYGGALLQQSTKQTQSQDSFFLQDHDLSFISCILCLATEVAHNESETKSDSTVCLVQHDL